MPQAANKKIFTFLLILVCVGVVIGVRALVLKKQESKAVLPARQRGNPQAGLRIVEYIDFQCPACANGVKMLHDYFEKYPNQILLEVKYFPLAMHSHGLESAVYGECAAQQGKFWPYFDLLIERQKQWSELIDANPAFRLIAQESGLNLNQFDTCIQSEAPGKVVSHDLTEGQTMGVQSTPTYFINNEMVVGTKSLGDKLRSYFKEPEPVAAQPPTPATP